MTDHDSDAEHPEALQPGRDHLRDMALLANRMVLMFGAADPVDPSRTMMWRDQADNRTYFLGYGSHWEQLTGEPVSSSERWLLVLDDTPEDADETYVPQSTTHLIDERNDLLAGNAELREEVATIIRAGMATQLLSIAAEAFPATDTGPGMATLILGDAEFHFKVFSNAEFPFAFLNVYGAQYELASDSTLEQTDPTFVPHKRSPMHVSLEQRLLLVSNVLAEGQRRSARVQVATNEVPAGERGQFLSALELELAGTYMQDVRDSIRNRDLPEALYRWEEDMGVFAQRTQASRVFGEAPGAVGTVVRPNEWLIETISLEGQATQREFITINLQTGAATRITAVKDSTGFANFSTFAGTDALVRAQLIMACVEADAWHGSLEPCPEHVAEIFRDSVLKLQPKVE